MARLVQAPDVPLGVLPMSSLSRLASLGLLSALLLVPISARADEYDDAVPLKPLAPAAPAPAAAPPAPAPAAPAAGTIDSVHLRTGAVYRGRVVEILPNSHVTIDVPGQGTKRVAWAEVEKVIVASYTGPLPPAGGVPSAYQASTPPLDAPMVGPRARVHITGRNKIILYRRPAGSMAWSQACTSPCDAALPIGDTYRLTGNGVPQSKEFRLDAPPGGSVDINVDPPSTPGIVLGGIMAYGGGLTAYVGLILTLAGLGEDSSYGRNRHETRDAGLITMAVGTGIGALGLVVFLNSSTTDIEQKSGGHGDASAKPLDGFRREAAWKTFSPAKESASGAAPATFPLLFTKSF